MQFIQFDKPKYQIGDIHDAAIDGIKHETYLTRVTGIQERG